MTFRRDTTAPVLFMALLLYVGSGSGTIAWSDPGPLIYPYEITLDISLQFDQTEPWVPPVDEMRVSALSVEECPESLGL